MMNLSWMWKKKIKKIIFDGLHPKKLKIVNLSKIYKIDVDSENLLTTNIAIPQRIVVISLHMNLTMIKMICSWTFSSFWGCLEFFWSANWQKKWAKNSGNYPQKIIKISKLTVLGRLYRCYEAKREPCFCAHTNHIWSNFWNF